MQIFIVNNVWNIMFINPNDTRLLRSDNVYSIGVCDNNTKTIYINNKLDGKLLDKVILHELTHAFIFESGIYFDDETEEVICDFMANYGNDVLSIADDVFNKLLRSVM